MFQSLFQWILLANQRTLSLVVLPIRVSILVLVDLAREYGTPEIGYLQSNCFNPCFSGSCSRMISIYGNDGCYAFQSLFQWILLANALSLVDIKLLFWFQSLFQWILLANYFNFYHVFVFHGFNPCFSGSCSRIHLPILPHIAWLCFNPCFSGSCSRIFSQMY